MNIVKTLILCICAFTALSAEDIELIQFSDLRLRNVNAGEATLFRTWTLNREKSDSPPVTVTFDARQIFGSDGCNRYSASLMVSGNSIKIGPIMATRAVCEALKGSDGKFRRTLALAEQYRITDKGQLELLDGSGSVILTFHR